MTLKAGPEITACQHSGAATATHHPHYCDVLRRQGTHLNTFPRLYFVLKHGDQDEDVRASARKTMASVGVVLGVRFLPYLMGELRSTLVWGYQVHVLGHCLHAMIQAFVAKDESALTDGSLQHCLPLLMDVYIEEIAGDVAQQK